jgi:hypothetical protein
VRAEIHSSSYVSYVHAPTALHKIGHGATNFGKTWVSSKQKLSQLHLRAVSYVMTCIYLPNECQYLKLYSEWGRHLSGATEEELVKPQSRYEPGNRCTEQQ